MADYILSGCSTADISKEHFERRNISYICFHYSLNGVGYRDDLGQTIPFPEFYRRLTEGEEPKTSQINTAEYLDYFEPFLQQGHNVLHVCLSSGISGAFHAACAAAEQLREKYPERRIDVVDSLAASSGYGMMLDEMADLRDQGMSQQDLLQWVLDNRLYLHHWFFSTDLTFYIKGGRVSKTAGTIGTLLGICPLLNVNDEGKLIPRMKVRSKKRVIQQIVDCMEQHARDGRNYSGKCYMCHSECLPDAQAVAALVKERFPKIDGDILINYIGTSIGSHTGLGTVAVFFWGDKRGR